jgi:phage terminase large subunit GpA-like protein
MIEMSDVALGRAPRIAPLPAFVTPEDVLRDALPLLDPPNRITVTDAAERFMRIPLGGAWRQFDRSVTPYMVEPADTTQSRRFHTCAFVGPSQSGKTVMLQSVSMHAVTCNPGPVQVIHMTQADANAWVEEKLDPIIYNSPDILDRLGKSREDSTFSRKRFKGMRLTIGYPVANQLSSRSQRLVALTDYDHMPQRLGPKDSPEGSPWTMALGRIKSFMSRGMVLVESTPAFPVSDMTWRPDHLLHPHALPPVGSGIVPIYNEGTRGRWYWECPDCEQLFEPRFDRLHYDATLDPGTAAEGAEMECPHCHCLIAHRHKVHLNRAALNGRGGWLHESSRIGEDGQRKLCRLGDADLRQTRVASWALNGAVASFANWIDLVTKYETARREFEATGDDVKLGQVFYTEIGMPFARREQGAEGEITVQLLRDNLRDTPQKVCPSWAKFVTVSVDAQGSWFAVGVTAWGDGGERALIDRFDLREPPEGAPNRSDMDGRLRALNPAKYPQDADVLLGLDSCVYPVEGTHWGLRPVAVVVDFNGPPGWSDNAEKFWRARKRDGKGGLWFLSMGRGGLNQSTRVWYEAPERGSKGRKARSIKLLNMAVDRLKDTVIAAIERFDGGPGAYHIGRWANEDVLSEVLSERRGAKGYDKKPGVVRNETLDLSVQAQAVAEYLGMNRINPEMPPDWARGDDQNNRAVFLKSALSNAPEMTKETEKATPHPPAEDRRGGGWIDVGKDWL